MLGVRKIASDPRVFMCLFLASSRQDYVMTLFQHFWSTFPSYRVQVAQYAVCPVAKILISQSFVPQAIGSYIIYGSMSICINNIASFPDLLLYPAFESVPFFSI
ncbi:hypothetical protein Tco_1228976 [Tanacetum coccineum]